MSSLPTQNISLKHINGDFQTIVDALDYAACGETGVSFYNSQGKAESSAAYCLLREKAVQTAYKLLSFGLERGDRIAIVAETSVEYFEVFYGCQYAGLVPCPIPHTAYMGGKSAYLERIKIMSQVAQPSLICLPTTLDKMSDEIQAITGVTTLTFCQLGKLEGKGCIKPLTVDEPAYIQFSSGSTSYPKGIIVTQRALSNNIKGILQECICINTTDRAFSWLPFYHDMGMVGFALAPLFAQTTVDYISPTTFARSPTLWLELMSRNGSTITYAPSFGYALAAKRYNQRRFPLDLSALRLAGIGGDMIRPNILELFTQTFSLAGFDSSAFTPSYGMAEATLLISFSHGVETDRIDVNKFEIEQIAKSTENRAKEKSLVLCGKPLKGHDLCVVDENNIPVPDRKIGHILVRGPSVAESYLTMQGTLSVCGWGNYLNTGDMGYIVDGKIVITGRNKEMILYNGRNIWPEDIENAVTGLTSITVKRAVAFSIDDDDITKIIVLAEHPSASDEAYKNAKTAIGLQLLAASGISAQIELVPLRTIPFTSSGKLARNIAKKMFIANNFSRILI